MQYNTDISNSLALVKPNHMLETPKDQKTRVNFSRSNTFLVYLVKKPGMDNQQETFFRNPKKLVIW